MAFIKNKFSRVFCSKSSTVSPCLSSSYRSSHETSSTPTGAIRKNPYSIEFCDREIHDPLYDCCFGLEIDRIQSGTVQKPAAKRKKPKRKRAKRAQYSSTSKISPSCCAKASTPAYSYDEECDDILVLEKSLNRPRKCRPDSRNDLQQLQLLCDRFDTVSLAVTPRQAKLYTTIPEHDKKIINRMAMKRTAELSRSEDARLARDYWERERTDRTAIQRTHATQLAAVLRDRRIAEKAETKRRLHELDKERSAYLEAVRTEISDKEQRVGQRLRRVALAKELRICERREQDLRKAEAAVDIVERSQLDDELRQQQCYSVLESRITRATALRAHYQAAYRRRLYADNELQHAVHSANYSAIERSEQYKAAELRTRIQERDKQTDAFVAEKQRYVADAREQARATAELRELVRRSISPDNYSFRAALRERPVSNMSLYESHVRLG